ncbi:MAG: hypothetical protein ABSF81_18555, partial [Bacteroidales bacterium]
RTVDTVLKALEPYAVKVASTVLRRERRGNLPDLSDHRAVRLSNNLSVLILTTNQTFPIIFKQLITRALIFSVPLKPA